MSYLLFLAAAAAAGESRRRIRHSTLKRMKETSGNGYSTSEGYYGRKEAPKYIDSLMHEIKEDDELREFFDTLMKQAQIYRMEQKPELVDEADQIVSLIKKYGEGIKTLDERLESLGVKAFNYYNDEGAIIYSENAFDLTIPLEEMKRQHICFKKLFNGLELTTELIDNPPFRERYEKQKEKCDEIRAKKAEAEKRLKREEFLDKIIFFQTDRRYKRILSLRFQISDYEKELTKESEYKGELEAFESFNPEQLKAIHDYLEAVQAAIEASRLLRDKTQEFIDTVPAITEKEVIEKAFERTMEERGMGEEAIGDIFRRMDRVAIRRQRGEYDGIGEWQERVYYWQHGRGTKKELVSGFVKTIYEDDPEFTLRNMEEVLQDEQERDE